MALRFLKFRNLIIGIIMSSAVTYSDFLQLPVDFHGAIGFLWGPLGLVQLSKTGSLSLPSLSLANFILVYSWPYLMDHLFRQASLLTMPSCLW